MPDSGTPAVPPQKPPADEPPAQDVPPAPADATAAVPPRRRSPLGTLRAVPFWAQIAAGLVLGLLLGLVARHWSVDWLATTLEQIGGIFVQLLKLAVPPLVFTAIVVSIAQLRDVADAARLAVRTLGWFLATSLIAVTVGLLLALVTDPGEGTGLTAADGEVQQDVTASWTDFLTGLVPKNVVTAFSEVNVLQIVFLAVVAGIAALRLGAPAAPFLRLTESVLALVQKALWWVIRLAPLGTLGLIGKAVAVYGWDLLEPLATFTVDVYVGCALVLFGVYPLLLRFAGGLSPLPYFRGAWPALELAFVSRSSVGTMPVTQRVTERLGVPKPYASFAVPFGATTKMDGCAAVYPALAAVFVAQVYGIDLGVGDYLLIAFVSVVGSAATAGLTGAIVMLTLTLSTLGLPLAGVGLLLAVDPVLDMIRTATNVAGQVLVPVLVAARGGTLDREAYAAAGRGGAEADAVAAVGGPDPAETETEAETESAAEPVPAGVREA